MASKQDVTNYIASSYDSIMYLEMRICPQKMKWNLYDESAEPRPSCDLIALYPDISDLQKHQSSQGKSLFRIYERQVYH
jgi:hypothetical protein